MRSIRAQCLISGFKRAAALAATAFLAAGCSDAPMKGFDSEKSRLRGALPSSVNCNETPHPNGKLLQCTERNFSLIMTGTKGPDGADIVNVQMTFNEFFNGGYGRDAVEKLLAIYDVTGPAANGCLRGAASGVYSKPADPFVLTCGKDDRSLRIAIRQQRKV